MNRKALYDPYKEQKKIWNEQHVIRTEGKSLSGKESDTLGEFHFEIPAFYSFQELGGNWDPAIEVSSCTKAWLPCFTSICRCVLLDLKTTSPP